MRLILTLNSKRLSQLGLVVLIELAIAIERVHGLCGLSLTKQNGSASTSTGTKTNNCKFRERTVNHLRNKEATVQHATVRPWEFHVAPMQCYTNGSLRKLYQLLSPHSIVWTEMEKVDDWMSKTTNDDIHRNNQYDIEEVDGQLLQSLTKRFGSATDNSSSNSHNNKHFEHVSQTILQLGSNNPPKLRQCITQTLYHYQYTNSFREINLNCGCPSIESGGASSYGASLMKNAPLTGALVRAARDAIDSAPSYSSPSSSSLTTSITEVSVKCRIAVYDTSQQMEQLQQQHQRQRRQRQYEELCHYLQTIQEAGGNHVILHARPAVLSGLNPTQNRIVPQLDHEFVRDIANEFPHMRITLNGGIGSLEELRLHVMRDCGGGDDCGTGTNVASHMAGRWLLRRPLDLSAVEESFFQSGSEHKNGSGSAVRAVERYVDHVRKLYSSYGNSGASKYYVPPLSELCLPLYLVAEQLREDYAALLNQDSNDNDMDGTTDQITSSSPYLTEMEIESMYDTIQECISWIQTCKNSGKGKRGNNSNNGVLNFKHLTTSFKGLVGKKVANKWKRNRAEL